MRFATAPSSQLGRSVATLKHLSYQDRLAPPRADMAHPKWTEGRMDSKINTEGRDAPWRNQHGPGNLATGENGLRHLRSAVVW